MQGCTCPLWDSGQKTIGTNDPSIKSGQDSPVSPRAGKLSIYSARKLQLALYGKIYLQSGFIPFFKISSLPKASFHPALHLLWTRGPILGPQSGLWDRKKVGRGLKHLCVAGKGEWAMQSQRPAEGMTWLWGGDRELEGSNMGQSPLKRKVEVVGGSLVTDLEC